MKKLSTLVATVSVLVLSAAPVLSYHGGDHNCADFTSQAAAQEYFRAMGGSPTNNVDDLDRDNDGVACEDASGYPDGARDETPATGAVTAPTAAPGAVPDVAMAAPSPEWPLSTVGIIVLLTSGVLMVRRWSTRPR